MADVMMVHRWLYLNMYGLRVHASAAQHREPAPPFEPV
jgi:hypothetical protein